MGQGLSLDDEIVIFELLVMGQILFLKNLNGQILFSQNKKKIGHANFFCKKNDGAGTFPFHPIPSP